MAATALPTALGGALETSLRRPPLCAALSAATPIVWPSPTIVWSPSVMARLLFAGAILLTTTIVDPTVRCPAT